MRLERSENALSSSGPWYWTALLAAATALLVYTEPFARLGVHAAEGLSLRTSDVNGRMRVEWDPGHAVIRNAEGATLEVIDGNLTNRYPVDPRVLRSGSFDYLRQSDDVLLTMILHKDGKPGVEGVIRSVGKPATAPPPAEVAAAPPVREESTRARTERRPLHRSRKAGSRR
jgi:hypothetical protein